MAPAVVEETWAVVPGHAASRPTSFAIASVEGAGEKLAAFFRGLPETEVVKVNRAKSSLKADVFAERCVFVSVKAQCFSLADGGCAVELTRRRGDAVLFARLYGQLRRHFGLVGWGAPAPCPELPGTPSSVLPLLDMARAGSSRQAEAAASLCAAAVDLGVDALCTGPVFAAVKELLACSDVAALYPTTKLLALLAAAPRGRASFDDELLTKMEALRLETRSRLVAARLRDALAWMDRGAPK